MAQRIERDTSTYAFFIWPFLLKSTLATHVVQIYCGMRGGDYPPETLAGIKAFTKSLVVNKPIPDWYYEFLDALVEVEDTMTCSAVRVGNRLSF